MLPVGPSTINLTPAAPPTDKSSPTNAFFLTDKPPSVCTEAAESLYAEESVTLFACTRPANVALPDVTSIPELKSALPSTFKVESKSTALDTSSVPAISVLPLGPATLNLLVLMLNEPPTFKVDCKFAVEVAISEDIVVVPPVTSSVPPTTVLPVGPSTVKLPPPISKSSPIYAFLVTAKPPAVNIAAPLLFAAVACAVEFALSFSSNVTIPPTPRVPSNVLFVYTFKSPPIPVLPEIDAPPADTLNAPLDDQDPPRVALVAFVRVVTPVTPKVLVTLVAPDTSKVLPNVVPNVTPSVPERVVLLVTPKVPPTLRLELAPTIFTDEFKVDTPSALNVPATNVLPVALATVNLFVLTLKSFVTSSVPSMLTFPPNDPSSLTVRSSPTYRSSPIPAPPPTMRAPVEEFVAFVVSNNLMEPASKPDLVPVNTSELLVAL